METGAAAPTKEELLDRIERSYARIEAAIARLTPEQLTGRRDANDWSAKDHLAHLAAWRRALAAVLTRGDMAAALGARLGLSVDEINAAIYDRARDSPLGEVLGDFRQAHQRVLAALAPLSIAELSLPYSHYQPDERDSRDQPVGGWVAGATFGHDEEHAPALEALAGRLSA